MRGLASLADSFLLTNGKKEQLLAIPTTSNPQDLSL